MGEGGATQVERHDGSSRSQPEQELVVLLADVLVDVLVDMNHISLASAGVRRLMGVRGGGPTRLALRSLGVESDVLEPPQQPAQRAERLDVSARQRQHVDLRFRTRTRT